MGEVFGCISRDDEDDPHQQAKHVDLNGIALHTNGAPPQDQKASAHEKSPTSLTRETRTGEQTYGTGTFGAQSYATAQSYGTGTIILGSSQSLDGTETRKRWTKQDKLHAQQLAKSSLERLQKGNKNYLAGSVEPQYGTSKATAIIACCTPLPIPADVLFSVEPDEIACTASASLQDAVSDDCGAAAVEFALASHADVSIVVVIETIGLLDREDEARERVLDACRILRQNSAAVQNAMDRSAIQMHAALFDLQSGQVRWLGDQIGKREDCLQQKNELKPKIPFEEAIVILKCGNGRASLKDPYATPRGTTPRGMRDKDPFAIIFSNFCPYREGPMIEQIFDVNPANIVSVTTVAPEASDTAELYDNDNSLEARWAGHIHYTEHCLQNGATRLLVVLCKPRQGEDVLQEVHDTMWRLLNDSMVIKTAVADGLLKVTGVIYNDSLDGRIWRIPQSNWIENHPREEDATIKLTQKILTEETFEKGSELTADNRGQIPPGKIDRIIESFEAGNLRFCRGDPTAPRKWGPAKLKHLATSDSPPKAIVLAGSSGGVRSPERILDLPLGSIIVHRTCGAISGRRNGCALRKLEKMIKENDDVHLVFVLVDVLDPAMEFAKRQVKTCSSALKQINAQTAIEQISPAANSFLTSGGHSVAEMHANYLLERLHLDSDFIIDLVCEGKLEIHCGMVLEDGQVYMKGAHSDLERVKQQRLRALRHNRKGFGLLSRKMSVTNDGRRVSVKDSEEAGE